MKRFFVAVVVFAFAVLNVAADEAKLRRSTRPIKGQYIIMLEPQGTDIEVPVQALTRMYGGDVVHKYRGAPWEGFSVKNLPEAAALALSRDPRVKAVEEDGAAEMLQQAPQHTQWALDRTNQRTLPLDMSLSAGCVGTYMVHIYIMDTGINDPNGTIFGARLIHGYRDPAIPTFADNYPHGTSVASIAGGSTYGVATGAQIVNVKVFESGRGLGSAAAIASIRDYINVHVTNGPKVVNMSLLYPESALLEAEIANSVNTHQITYAVGAGNGINYPGPYGTPIDACTAGSPASMGGGTAGVITVGATYLENNYTTDARSDHSGLWASNFGPCVDIFAPGTNVAAYGPTGNLTQFSGTSSATPYVAGAAARRQAIHWSSYGTIKSPASVEADVKADATPNVITNVGAGSPNLLLYRFYLRCRAVGS